jgi:hypothetical protein
MTIEQTVEIPASLASNGKRRLTIDVPPEVPAGRVVLSFTPAHTATRFDTRLWNAVDPAMYGKGEISGDIIGPFYDEWERH